VVNQHPIIRMWESYRDSPRPGPDANPRSDHLQLGIDYLSLVSSSDFETFMMHQLGSDELQRKLGFRDVRGWLTSASSNHPSSALRIKDISLHELIKFPVFIDRLRREIWHGIETIILNARQEHLLPDAGTILYFTSDLRYSYVITYHMHFDRPVIEILGRIESPKGVCDIEDIRTLPTQRARNRAKHFLTSAHKIVVQNGVLTHVDRRYDKNVFGPTIDTLLLARVLYDDNKSRAAKSFVEIGSGSGHISATAAAMLPSVDTFVALDISEFATSCTVRNIRSNLRYLRSMKIRDYKELMIVFGSYEKNVFKSKFDLAVSNPPYIERRRPVGDVFEERFAEAVAGTELIANMLRTLPDLLTPDGRLLLMVSSVTGEPESLPIPDGFMVRSAVEDAPDGIEVPFDVEEVLDQPEWLADLLDSGAVRPHNGGRYTHRLKPVWIERDK